MKSLEMSEHYWCGMGSGSRRPERNCLVVWALTEQDRTNLKTLNIEI